MLLKEIVLVIKVAERLAAFYDFKHIVRVSRDQLGTYQFPKYVGEFNQTLIGQLLESPVYQSLGVYAYADDVKLFQFRNHQGTWAVNFIFLSFGLALIYQSF